MGTTRHTITNASGTAEEIAVNHTRHDAVQYDFYIPSAIWNDEAVQTFLGRLLVIEPGATIFTNGLIGLWHGDTEQTEIYRFIVRTDKLDKKVIDAALELEIGQLMADLAPTPLKQKAFCYTETEITVTTASLD